jgi:large subunit ribosomal protein L24
MNNNKVYKIKLKIGDTVMVRSGKDKGKTGKVVATHPRTNKVTVEGVNMAKKHTKPNKEYPQGGIVDITRPIWVSKVGIVDASAKTKQASRIAMKAGKDGKKVRVFAKSQKEIK